MNNSSNRSSSSDSNTSPLDELPEFKTRRENNPAVPDFERQWLDDYLEGDETAFLSFYHRYRAPVFRCLLAHLPSDDANRLYVQTWLNFLKIAREIPRDICPGAAVFAEAHRLILEGYRTQDKSLLLSFADGVVETVGELPQLAFNNDSELAATKLTSLPPAWREALQIYLETGFDGESLGYALHVSRETARSRLKRAFSQWRKQWPDGDTGVEDTLLRSTQHWIFRYRSLVSIEPPDYLDARILRQADWQIRWLPQMGYQFGRYWHIVLTAALTGLGVFGYLWTQTADPDFTLEIAETPRPTIEIASQAPASPTLATLPPLKAITASQAEASALIASAPIASESGAVADPVPPIITEEPAVSASIPLSTPASAVTAKPRKPRKPKNEASAAVAASATASAASEAYSEMITPSGNGLQPTPPSSAEKIAHREAEAAINKVRQLRRAGQKDEADRLLERLKSEYPTYPLPRDIQ